MAKKKSGSTPKFADKSQKQGLLVRECPECHKFHHPRVANCPNCGHTYPPSKKSAKKKVVKKKPAAKAPSTAASRANDRLQAGIDLVAACKGDLKEARSVLETIEQIRKL
jgi:DNA-directed RNA polymerase subunit M/transcription elongation factor TFIIS